jgi:hypothetical protein
MSASILWVSQGSYVGRVADENRKGELFGLFWALMMSSQILGNLLITFILSKLGEITYFYLLTTLGCNIFVNYSFKFDIIFIFTKCSKE